MNLIEFVTKTLPAVALLAGGAWAIFNWYVTERRRRSREIPSLDGTISTAVLKGETDRVVVTITTKWRNPGVDPVSLDPATTYVDVFECAQVPPVGPVDLERGLGTALFRCMPLADASVYILEPGTNSELTCHCVVRPGRLYFVRWLLMETPKGKDQGYSWSRETWLDTRVSDTQIPLPPGAKGAV